MDYALSKGVDIVVVHSGSLDRYEMELKKLVGQKKCVFVFSSNDEGFIRKNLMSTSTMFYTDFWDLKKGKCLGEICSTY